MVLVASIAKALEELRASFPGSRVDHDEDGAGGAYMTVHDVPLGPAYQQPASWFRFHITHQYPYADIYPHYVRPDLSRADGRALGDGLGSATFRNESVVQISRRSNNRDAKRDTAALKLQRVVQWLRSHP